MRSRPLVSIIGSGRVGSACAVFLMVKGICDIRLIDVVQGLPQGEALDISHAAAILGIDIDIRGSNDMKDIENSDIVIVTAGFARKPGMTREELAIENAKIVKSICEKIREYTPDSIVIIVTNPVDIMTHLALNVLKSPRERVIGFSGILDSGRYRYYISKKLNISTSCIEAYVIGQHGEKMIPVVSQTRVHGVPITKLLDRDAIEEICNRVIKAGEEIIKLKGWSASHAVGAGVSELADSIIRDRRREHIVSTLLNGEYGIRDVVIEAPAIVGRNGIEKIVELELSEDEKKKLFEACNWIRNVTDRVLKEVT